MKTKNMRKKALLASMAMLLVAVVALSGATYAWFTSNTTATATGLKFQTNQSSSLLFAAPGQQDSYYEDSSNWVGTYNLKNPAATTEDPRDILTPCSMNVDGEGGLTNAIEVKRVGAGSGDEKTSKVLQIGPGGSTYTETFYVKSTSATPLYLTNFAMANENTNLSGALRYAVKVGTNAAKIFAPVAAETGVTRKCVTAGTVTFSDPATAPTFNDLYTGAASLPSGITVVDQTISTVGATTSGKLCDLAANTKQLVTITFWLEGNDQRCNNTAMGQWIDGFTFTFGTGENS